MVLSEALQRDDLFNMPTVTSYWPSALRIITCVGLPLHGMGAEAPDARASKCVRPVQEDTGAGAMTPMPSIGRQLTSNLFSNLSTCTTDNVWGRPWAFRFFLCTSKRDIVLKSRLRRSAIVPTDSPSSMYHFFAKAISVLLSFDQAIAATSEASL